MCITFQFFDQKQLKWQKKTHTDLHYQQRLLSVVMSAWKVRCLDHDGSLLSRSLCTAVPYPQINKIVMASIFMKKNLGVSKGLTKIVLFSCIRYCFRITRVPCTLLKAVATTSFKYTIANG